jgi:hypothetical protein
MGENGMERNQTGARDPKNSGAKDIERPDLSKFNAARLCIPEQRANMACCFRAFASQPAGSSPVARISWQALAA